MASYVYLDGTPVTTCSYSATSVSCPVSGLLPGNRGISAKISDNAGNSATKNGSFAVSVSAKPKLTLTLNGTPIWDGATLHVPTKISNAGSYTAFNVRLTGGF